MNMILTLEDGSKLEGNEAQILKMLEYLREKKEQPQKPVVPFIEPKPVLPFQEPRITASVHPVRRVEQAEPRVNNRKGKYEQYRLDEAKRDVEQYIADVQRLGSISTRSWFTTYVGSAEMHYQTFQEALRAHPLVVAHKGVRRWSYLVMGRPSRSRGKRKVSRWQVWLRAHNVEFKELIRTMPMGEALHRMHERYKQEMSESP